MQCPYCQSENRDDREDCYHCKRDLTMLRLIVNKAKQRYNAGLELADRGHNEKAIAELKNALALDHSLTHAHVVLGSLYAREERFDEARAAWRDALALDLQTQKAHEYLGKVDAVETALPTVRRLKRMTAGLGAVAAFFLLTTILFASLAGGFGSGPETGGTTGAGGDPATTRTQTAAAAVATAASEAARASEIRQLRAQLDAARADTAKANQKTQDAQARIAQLTAQVQGMAAQFERSMMADLQRARRGYQPGTAQFAPLMTAIDKAVELLDGTDSATSVTAMREEVIATERAYQLDRARNLAEAGTLEEAAEKLLALRGEPLGLDREIDALLADRKTREEGEATAVATATAVPDEVAAAAETPEPTPEVTPTAPATTITTTTTNGDAIGSEAAAGVTAEAAKSMFDAKQWEDFLGATENLAALGIADDQRGQWETMRQTAWAQWAAETYTWFEKTIDPKVMGMRLSDEEARRTVAVHERYLDHLPANLSYTAAPIRFYTAAACLQLGQPAEARRLLADIDAMERVPSYIKPSIATFRQQYAGRLGEDGAAQ
jgi:hypothetical protein